jgi:hypothetical protein
MEGKSRSQQILVQRAAVALLLLASAAGMPGCTAANFGDRMPQAVGGLPEGVPPRPQTTSSYPAVNDVPPPRASSVLTSEEQMKVEDELTAARNRAASAAGSKSKPAGSTGDQ